MHDIESNGTTFLYVRLYNRSEKQANLNLYVRVLVKSLILHQDPDWDAALSKKVEFE
jgi:hypothetical protein